MSKFFERLDKGYNWFNDEIYKYLVFLYYLGKVKKPLYALLLGAMTALALPPFGFFFILPFTFASVIRMTDFCQKKLQAYLVGFWFSFGFGIAGFYWVSFSLFRTPELLWLFPLALLGIPAVYAAFNAVLFPLYSYLMPYATATRKIIVFSVLWVLFEYLRGFVLLDFPWNFIGYSFSYSLKMLQITSLIGVLGLGFFTMLWACSFHLLMLTGDKDVFIKYFKFLVFNNIILVLFLSFGFLRLQNKANFTRFEDVKLRLVQGNVPAGGGYKRDFWEDKKLGKYLKLMNSAPLDDIDLIIWGEGAIDSFPYNDMELRRFLASFLQGEQMLMTGALRFEHLNRSVEIFNSMLIISSGGGVGYYDKHYLVPFGEFVPLKGALPLPSIVTNGQDFTRGSGMKAFKVASKVPPFTPLICYEVGFSGSILKYEDFAPKWILNITNDAWFGFSSQPFQHFSIARLRAIEEGVPLVRVSNNGFSGVFDPLGRVLLKTGLFSEEVRDFKLPRTLANDGVTLFSRVGNIPLLIFIAAVLLWQLFDVIYITHDSALNSAAAGILEKKSRKKGDKQKDKYY